MAFTDTIKKDSQTNCLENRYLTAPSPQSKIGVTNAVDLSNQFSTNFTKNGAGGFTSKALNYAAGDIKINTTKYTDGCAGFGGGV